MPGSTCVSPQASALDLWEPRRQAALGLSVIVPCLFQVWSPGPVCCRGRGPRPLWVSTAGEVAATRQSRGLSAPAYPLILELFISLPLGWRRHLLTSGWGSTATVLLCHAWSSARGLWMLGSNWASPVGSSSVVFWPCFPWWNDTPRGVCQMKTEKHTSGLQTWGQLRALQRSWPHLIREGHWSPLDPGVVLVKSSTEL